MWNVAFPRRHELEDGERNLVIELTLLSASTRGCRNMSEERIGNGSALKIKAGDKGARASLRPFLIRYFTALLSARSLPLAIVGPRIAQFHSCRLG